MNNKKFHKYVNELSNLNLENFSQHIKAFSKFLSYIDSDYKYNGTYLKQYIDEFEKACVCLPEKDKKYKEIVSRIILLGMDCDVVDIMVDNVFHAYISRTDNVLEETQYVAFDREKMVSKFIEIRVMFGKDNEEYVFRKKYDDIENQLLSRIYEDVNTFLKFKELGGSR